MRDTFNIDKITELHVMDLIKPCGKPIGHAIHVQTSTIPRIDENNKINNNNNNNKPCWLNNKKRNYYGN